MLIVLQSNVDLTLFMNQFNERLDAIALDRQRVHYLDLRNTLPNEDFWANELHPKNKGFEMIAQEFDDLIQELVSSD